METSSFPTKSIPSIDNSEHLTIENFTLPAMKDCLKEILTMAETLSTDTTCNKSDFPAIEKTAQEAGQLISTIDRDKSNYMKMRECIIELRHADAIWPLSAYYHFFKCLWIYVLHHERDILSNTQNQINSQVVPDNTKQQVTERNHALLSVLDSLVNDTHPVAKVEDTSCEELPQPTPTTEVNPILQKLTVLREEWKTLKKECEGENYKINRKHLYETIIPFLKKLQNPILQPYIFSYYQKRLTILLQAIEECEKNKYSIIEMHTHLQNKKINLLKETKEFMNAIHDEPQSTAA